MWFIHFSAANLQETKRFIIDEETGERIPDPSASSRSLCTFSEETDLSKELVELAELDYLLGDMQAPDMSCQMKQVQQNNIPLIQPQQANYNSADMIVQTADQPNIPPGIVTCPLCSAVYCYSVIVVLYGWPSCFLILTV